MKIERDVVGGSYSGTSNLDATGLVWSFKRIASVTINGSIISGTNSGTGTLTRSGGVLAGDDIGSLTVKNDLIGNNANGSVSRVVILARGKAVPTATSNLAIGKVSIGGDVNFAEILAGYDTVTCAGKPGRGYSGRSRSRATGGRAALPRE